MFGVKYIRTCHHCKVTHEFKSKRKWREFGHICPACGGYMDQIPLSDYEPMPNGMHTIPPPPAPKHTTADYYGGYQPALGPIPEPPKCSSNDEKSSGKLKVNINIDTSELDRLAIGGRLYDALSWKNTDRVNLYSILSSDKETKTIMIKESDLMKLIQLVTPLQPTRQIKLIHDIDPEDCKPC